MREGLLPTFEVFQFHAGFDGLHRIGFHLFQLLDNLPITFLNIGSCSSAMKNSYYANGSMKNMTYGLKPESILFGSKKYTHYTYYTLQRRTNTHHESNTTHPKAPVSPSFPSPSHSEPTCNNNSLHQ